ncbi:amidohydrolase family protein [Nocardioides sp. L-11A]|uniref:amidohydrolase family protein n=1 Tax=Nocardioides sp. L-11A TaxID=3043848 RepID=UPI002499EDAB|nr:amidohydrolase family protein [Nocardioides sp. L-11A]
MEARRPGAATRRPLVIRGGTILTFEGRAVRPVRGDLLVDDGSIAEVGGAITSPGAEVIDATDMLVMPGMVDSHLHLWSSLGRNFVNSASDFYAAKGRTAEHYSPDDFYRSVKLGLTQCIDAGITTVHNWSHNTRSPEHAEAELRAHLHTGLRARYSYGHRDGLARDEVFGFGDVDRIRETWLDADDAFEGLMTLGVNLRGPDGSDEEVFAAEMVEARSRGLPVSIHAGQTSTTVRAAELARRGLFGPSMLVAHFLSATPQDWAAMAGENASLAFAVLSELRLGRTGAAHSALMQARAAGVNVSLSTALGPTNLFEVMNVVFHLGIPWSGTATEACPDLSFDDVFAMATLNGAAALGLSDVTGSIVVGKRADIVLVRATDLNLAPMGAPVGALIRFASPANVDTVIVDGRVLKRAGTLVHIDVDQVVAEARESAESVLARAAG